MKQGILFGALTLAALIGACGDQPTDPMAGVEFDLSAMYHKGATGAMPGSPSDFVLADYDENGDGFVCVKTVPESDEGRADTRTIIKDTFDDGSCPGGFELTAVGGGLCELFEKPAETGCYCPVDEGEAFLSDEGECIIFGGA